MRARYGGTKCDSILSGFIPVSAVACWSYYSINGLRTAELMDFGERAGVRRVPARAITIMRPEV